MFRIFLFVYFMLSTLALAAPAGLELNHAELVEVNTKTYSLSEYHQARPPEIKLLPGAKLLSCQWQGRKCGAAPWILSVNGSLPQKPKQTRFSLSYLWQGKKLKFELDVLADSFPYMNLVGRSSLSLPLIFSLMNVGSGTLNSCYLMILSAENELIFFRHLPILCADFRPHQTTAGLLYSYQEVQEGVANVAFFGTRVILKDDFSVLKRIDENFDGHEFILLSPDHWIGMEVELDRLTGGAVYFDKRIRERKNGKIVFDWGVSDYIKQTKSEGVSLAVLAKYKNEVVVDLVHLNSVQIVTEDEWLIGLGYSGVGMLSKKERRLKWIFGGFSDQFSLPAAQSPIFNHTPIFNAQDESLYLFSNRTIGSLIDSAFARVLKYELDVTNRRVKEFHNLRDKNEFAYQMGSLQVNGDVLSIGMGTAEKANFDFVEMKGTDETWSLTLKNPRASVYRFYRQP